MEKSAIVQTLIVIWTILGCLIVESTAGRGTQFYRNGDDQQENAVQQKEKKSISCYQCNSEYDPNCGSPFDPYTLGTVNCALRPKPEHLGPNVTATICRKTIQKVYGKTRVIRGCGYITDERDDKECVKRSGTHDVQVLYCSCTTSLCNGGYEVRVSWPFAIATFLIATLFKTRHFDIVVA